MEADARIERTELFDLYGKAIDEYHFNVELNWKRTQYYLVLSAGILAAGTGLFGSGSTAALPLVAVIFLVGIVVSILGARATTQGHRYYRRSIHKKTLLEKQLGLLEPIAGYAGGVANLAIATTRGMGDSERILGNTQQYLDAPLKKDSIIWQLRRVLYLLAVLDGFGLYLVLAKATWAAARLMKPLLPLLGS